jgi:hypothetical protein
MARLDWEQANRLDRQRVAADAYHPAPTGRRRRQAKYQQALKIFAAKHDIRCFKCNTGDAEWAKSGIATRGPWIICVPCVTSGQQPGPQRPSQKP